MLIYIVTNRVNGKVYIGQTVRSVEERWYLHCKAAKGASRLPIHCAIRKYGEHNFFVVKVSDATSLEEMDSMEAYFISKYNSMVPYGYNRTEGGKGFNGRHTQRTRERMSKSHIGKKRTPAELEKQRKTQKALWTDSGYRQRNRGRTGLKSSEEHRRKISETITQHWKTRKLEGVVQL
jgi:group I intron endonuclease